jgi:T-complex protein 1 subunit delta
MENTVIISDHTQMDRAIKEERQYILNIIKQIKKTNCNVLLIQKSILRDAISDLAIHYLAKMKILIVKDVEREDVPFIAKVYLYRRNNMNNIKCFRLLVVNQLQV